MVSHKEELCSYTAVPSQVEGVSLEVEDSHGMTPLMHSCWKGTQAVTEYLIKQGW